MILCLIFLRPVLIREWPVLKQHLPFLAAMGAIGFTGFNAFFYIAAHSTTALNIGILQGSIPVFVLLGAWIAYRKPIVPVQVIGVLITMVGVIFIGSQGSLDRLASLAFNKGDFLQHSTSKKISFRFNNIRSQINSPHGTSQPQTCSISSFFSSFKLYTGCCYQRNMSTNIRAF